MAGQTDRWLGVAAVGLPMATSAALIPFRDHLDGTNAALILVVTVVAIASSGRRPAAIVSALSASAAFNLFHTSPHYSLRIDSGSDLETAGLLLVVGIAVGELAVRNRRARADAARGVRDLARLHGVGRLVADGEDPDYVLLATASELVQLLSLVDCAFEPDRADEEPLAIVERDGVVRWGPTVWDTTRWGLPREGAAIPLWARGRRYGRFVLQAPVGHRLDPDELARAVGLVDAASNAIR
jgi:K+-sensing histidine kinase KdpD